MKIKYIILSIVCVLSFYLSDQIILGVENTSPIMKEINSVKDNYELEAVDAIIDGDTIIPGKKGKSVNERKSYLKMHEFGVFNENFIIYDYVDPNITLNDNLDKIIIKSTNNVSIIIDSNKIEEYLIDLDIPYTKIIYDSDSINSKTDYINGNSEKNQFDSLNRYLTNKKINNKICLIDFNDINLCINNKYYLVQISYYLSKNNYINYLNNISTGDFIYLNSDLSLNDVKIIITELKKDNLSFDKLSLNIQE